MKRPILFFWFILFFLYSCQRKKGESSFLPLPELQPLTLGMMPTLDGLPFHSQNARHLRLIRTGFDHSFIQLCQRPGRGFPNPENGWHDY